jgi:hypothetical protein
MAWRPVVVRPDKGGKQRQQKPHEWQTNPATGLKWTAAELDTVLLGVKSKA